MTESYGTPIDFITFSRYFHRLLTSIHVWIVVSLPNFHKLFDKWMYTFWYVIMPNVTTGYGRFYNLDAFLGNFHILLHVWNAITWSNFTNFVLNQRYRDLCATRNLTKSVILSIFLNFPLRSGTLFTFGLAGFH